MKLHGHGPGRHRRHQTTGPPSGRGARRPAALLAATLAFPALLALLAGGCGAIPGTGGTLSGSGTPATKEYTHSGFTKMRIDNSFTATITRGDAFAVSVTVDDNVVKHLRVALDGDTLHIGLDPALLYHDTTLKARVSMPALRGLEVTGASRANVEDFASQDPLDLAASGAGVIALPGVSAGDVTVNLSGAARLSGGLRARGLGGETSGGGLVSLEGSAATEKLEASGGAQLDLAGVTAQDAAFTLSGGAHATARVTGTLKVEASGGARLDYYGSPASVDAHTSGGAQVQRAGP